MSKKDSVEPASNTNLSVAALILAFVFPIAGIVVAFLAQKEIKDSKGTKGGEQLVKIAFILSALVLLLEVAWLITWINAYMQAVNETNDLQNQMKDIFDNLDTEPEVCWDPYYEEYTVEACY